MNRVSNEIPEKATRGGTEDEVAEVLTILSYYMRKAEEERGDSKRTILLGNPLSGTKTSINYLTEKQYSAVKGFFCRHAAHVERLEQGIRSEVYLYLGFSHERGVFGVEKNHRKAFGNYVASAQLGNAVATFRVAQCYEKGVGKRRDMGRALHFYRCAAKLGLIDAMHTYGAIILFGDVKCCSELDVGYFYLRLAAKKATNTYPYPLYDLGRCYEKGSGPNTIPPDDLYAFRLYSRGASLDCPNCQFRVGRCLENGELGQEKDTARAVEWYMKAADLGQADAQFALSTLFLHGIRNVLERNHEMVFRFSLRAATREHIGAAYLISECYEQGVGVKRSAHLAMWWSTIAEEFQKTHEEPAVDRVRITAAEGSVDDSRSEFDDGVLTDMIMAQVDTTVGFKDSPLVRSVQPNKSF